MFKMPMVVAKKLERKQSQFFWGDTNDKKKIHTVKWDDVAKSKDVGGLGVKRMIQQNLALLAKWWWRFGNDKSALWVRVIKGKYGLEVNSWLPSMGATGSSSKVWRDICSLDNPLSHLGYSISEGFRIQVFSGSETKFWEHIWLGDTTLREEFPRLFMLSNQKVETINNMRNVAGNGSWNIEFRRELRAWENDQFEDLSQRLQRVMLIQGRADKLIWKWSLDGMFSVKSAYGQWETMMHQNNTLLGSIWKNLAPLKVEIFAWKAIKGKILTRSVLLTRNVLTGIHLGLCPLCLSHLETPNHLMLHCRFSWTIWSLIIKWWKLHWVSPFSVEELALWWLDNRFRNLEKHLWEICFYAVLWSIWLARNDIAFNNAVIEAEEVGELVKTRVAMWVKVKFNLKLYSVEDFRCFLDAIRKVKV